MIATHITKYFPYVSGFGRTNRRTVPQALALQIQAVSTLPFQNLKFHNQLLGVRGNMSLTVFSQALLVMLCWGVRREKGPCHCNPSAVRGRDGIEVEMEEPRLDLDFGPVLTHRCLRHEHPPNSCRKPPTLYYFPCLLGSNQSTHHRRAWPGKSWLSRQAGLRCLKTEYPLTSVKISRLQ